MTATAALSPVARSNAEETYNECLDLIRSVVWKVIRQYGGDFDELMSEANAAFLDAYRTFDGSSAFTSWLHTRVWYSCVSFVRDRLEEQSRYKWREAERATVDGISIKSIGDASLADESIHNGVENVPDRRSTWRVSDLLEELGEDARMVVSLTLETPTELARIAEQKGGQPRNLRSSLRQHLAEMGWTAVRIAESFSEVRRALAG
jgi:RNA polymerase sigma factor (sigma-70 family)